MDMLRAFPPPVSLGNIFAATRIIAAISIA
jgi:hypothetical protein